MSQQTQDTLRKRIVGNFLRKSREKAELTQWSVAHALEYTTAQFVSNWERGVSLPPLDTLPKLATLYRVTPAQFVSVMTRYDEEMLKLQKKALREVFK